MEENIFFDTRRLKYRGSNVIIGKTVRIRYPELVELHDNVIVDDFTYISCGLTMLEHSLLESNCTFMGGKEYKIVVGKHTAIATHTAASCAILSFRNGLQLNHARDQLNFQSTGDIILGDYIIVGAHSTLSPGIIIGDGARIGAYTRVSKNLDPWGLYYGMSAERVGDVDQQNILNQLNNYVSKK